MIKIKPTRSGQSVWREHSEQVVVAHACHGHCSVRDRQKGGGSLGGGGGGAPALADTKTGPPEGTVYW